MMYMIVRGNASNIMFCFLKTFYGKYMISDGKIKIEQFEKFFETDKKTIKKIVIRNKGFIFKNSLYFFRLKDIRSFEKDLNDTFAGIVVSKKLMDEDLLEIDFKFYDKLGFTAAFACVCFWVTTINLINTIVHRLFNL